MLTKKDERRDWEAKELAKAFKMQSFDMMDDPMKISKYLKKSLFKKPTLVNIHTQRIFWHCLLYTSPSPRDRTRCRMPSSA